MSNSLAEYKVMRFMQRQTGHRFKHGSPIEPDLIDTQTGQGIEVKGIDYPLSHFANGQIRINAESIGRHARESKPDVCLLFNSGELLIANSQTISAVSRIEHSQVCGDRETYLCPLSIFRQVGVI